MYLIDLRRISGLFLAELFYNNDDIRLRATKLLEIYPSEGRVTIFCYHKICLNQIPQQIQKYPSTFKSTKISNTRMHIVNEISLEIERIGKVLLDNKP